MRFSILFPLEFHRILFIFIEIDVLNFQYLTSQFTHSPKNVIYDVSLTENRFVTDP